MKHLLILTILGSLFSGMAFAVETTTDCPMMKELNERNNPKANLGDLKLKVKKAKGTATAQ